jgi:hypothetical protein
VLCCRRFLQLACFVLEVAADPPLSDDDPVTPPALEVLSLGVGTKFLAPAVAASADGQTGLLVRDSHAEVRSASPSELGLYAPPLQRPEIFLFRV